MKILDEMNGRRKAASPGPWRRKCEFGYWGVATNGNGEFSTGNSEQQGLDAEFVAHSITDCERYSKVVEYFLKHLDGQIDFSPRPDLKQFRENIEDILEGNE